MAVVAEELISDLIVRDGKLRSGIRSAQQAYGAGIGSMRNDTKRFESEFNRSAGNISTGFKQLAGTLAAGISIGATAQLIDGYTKLQNQLRVAGLEGRALLEVQERLRAIGAEYGTDLGALATVYGKVTIAGKELGATSEQILTVNEAVAAALKISGSSAEQAQGALLQLSQAMSSGTVRAEELNSIMEGAFPLAQAAARGIDRFGGSVAKLRAAVLEGEVSSREFFNGVIAGAPALLDQAAKANLTLAQSFTVLKNELMLYVGGAASANGVTGALATGIKSLADNLDRIIPALAAIAAVIGVRYVAALAASTAATVAQSVAATRAASVQTFLNGVMAESTLIQNLYATSAVRTTTALGTMSLVARGAGASLVAALGGPVSAAIIAVGAALVFLSAVTDDAVASVEELKASNATAADELQAMIGRLKAAGVETKEFAAAADAASTAVDGMADSYRRALIEARKFNKENGQADFSETVGAIREIDDQIARLRSQRNAVQLGNPGQKMDSGGVMAQIDEQIRQLVVSRAQLVVRRDLQIAGIQNGVDVNEDAPRPGSAAAAKPPKKARGRSGPSAAELAEQERQRSYREEQELRSLRLEEIRAKEQLAATTEERADLQRDALDLERQSREAEIAEGIRRKDLTLDQAQAQLEIVNSLYGTAAVLDEQGQIVTTATQSLYGAAIAADAARKAEEERASLSQTQADIQRDELQFAYDMADTNSERRDIALQMIELDAREQRAKLEGIIAVEKIGSLRRREAEALLAALDGRTANARDRATRDTENPLERLARESDRSAEQIKEDIQSIQAEGLNALGDGITDVIMQTRSLGDVFKSVANQIIADLIRIAVQRAVIGPLANALFGGADGDGGGKGLLGNLGTKISSSVFGRAGGGPVRAGQLYRVNEGQQEFFRPATDGRVVPLSQQAQAARPAGGASAGPTIVQLAVAPGEMFVPIVEGISGNVSVRTVQAAAPGLVRAATIETTRRAGRPRT